MQEKLRHLCFRNILKKQQKQSRIRRFSAKRMRQIQLDVSSPKNNLPITDYKNSFTFLPAKNTEKMTHFFFQALKKVEDCFFLVKKSICDRFCQIAGWLNRVIGIAPPPQKKHSRPQLTPKSPFSRIFFHLAYFGIVCAA